MDTRIKKLSDLLVRYSCDLQKGEKILISYEGECYPSDNQRRLRLRRLPLCRNP